MKTYLESLGLKSSWLKRRAMPRIKERPVDEPAVQTAQLRKFLVWLTPVVLCFALLEGVVFMIFRDTATAVTGAVLLAVGLSLLVAHLVVMKRGGHREAVGIVCSGLLIGTLVLGTINPTLTPALTLSPLLAIGVALPYVESRVLKWIIVAAWFTTVAVVTLGEVVHYSSTLPVWYDSGFRVVSMAVGLTVTLVLLWQFRSRLMGTLAKEARRAEERLRYEATHDPLTSLPNRPLLMERLRRNIERAKKDERYIFAVLFMDLDRFKNINDSLGHAIGDHLLVDIASRLQATVNPTDTVSRFGGDEFVILLEDIVETRDAVLVAKKLQEELKAPFKVHGHELYSTASIGIVVGHLNYNKPEELLRDADTAMYSAKEAGKARLAVFDSAMRTRVVSLLRLENDLRRAVEQEEFTVYYQPVVKLASGRVVGFEALVRWQHPERGLLSPEEFVPLAEETGLIFPIDRLVLEEACRQTKLWQKQFPDQLPLGISVNVSASQLARSNLSTGVSEVLLKTELDGRDLSLEVTESTFMHEEAASAATLACLKGLGVRVHLDDFGTGYSSLGLLHRYPIDALKIDRSFVGAMGEKAEIVRTISTLAHQLGMHVIAEGIETSNQLEQLREMGCDLGQGYRFSEPLTGEAAEALLDAAPNW